MAGTIQHVPQTHIDRLRQLRAEARQELTGNILPFSILHVLDREQGGFYGHVANDRTIQAEAPKGLVQHSRMLWTFAQAGRAVGDAGYGQVALHAYRALMDWFRDAEHGGFFWMVDYRGRPLETAKFVYGQAFALYGLAEQHRASGDAGCLEEAIELYRLLEGHCRDLEHGGYWEACQRDWTPAPEVHVDPTPLPVAKGMNTHLHLLEAYTNLLRVWDDAGVRARLQALIQGTLDQILNPETHHLGLYFDRQWRPLSDRISYGHDIEGSWLLVEAAEVLGEPALLDRVREATLQMAYTVLEQGVDSDGGLFDEHDPTGEREQAKTWWPQAEAVVGFLNAYQLSGDASFLEASLASWAFIRQYFVDREQGGWFHTVDGRGCPHDREKAGPWKTPYHGSRACLEMMDRTSKMGF